ACGGLRPVRECLLPPPALSGLPRLIGAARAQELILLGEPLDARTAERYSLVNRVVPAAEFPRALDETVQRFLALPPASARASKLLTGRAFDLDLEAFRLQMQTHFKVCRDSEEHRQAMEIFRARRRS